MRKFMKTKLLDMIKLMVEANDYIQKCLKKNSEQVEQILQDCLNSAIAIGSKIEENEGNQIKTIAILEDYCENIHQIHQSLIDAKRINELLQKNKRLLSDIARSIKNDIPNSKKEIVFLPYKASMWDSLESIWKAVKEDEAYEAFVIPIPYYVKNANGEITEIHYEGGDYPKEVSIASWETYDFENRRPDMIFIHNPYDDKNYVTTVHPMFFAKELIKYTEKLIYIPYFVSIDDVPAHFCVLPGTLYADNVIVQSKKVRNTYIKEFNKFEKQYNLEGQFGDAEKKFIAIGSPKFDKVIQTKKEDIELPEDWKRLIINQYGRSKKVVFYNTTIQALLENRENAVDQIQRVLETFQKRKETTVLLWRPHPLAEATMESMAPKTLLKYKELIKTYRTERWGIYDDSADLNRAIAISDAYYGDPSSVVVLFRLTGKPIMIQYIKKDQE